MSERLVELQAELEAGEFTDLIEACREGHATLYGQEDLGDAVAALSEALATAQRRLKHSEFHRSHNRRSMQQRGRTIIVLMAKIERQRAQLRERTERTQGKRLTAMERAAELHHSLRTEP